MRASSARKDRDQHRADDPGQLYAKRTEATTSTYKETQTIGFEGCTTTIKIAEDGSRVALLRFGPGQQPAPHRAGPPQSLPLRDGGAAPSLWASPATASTASLTEKGGSAAFSYLLDADDARIVSRNTPGNDGDSTSTDFSLFFACGSCGKRASHSNTKGHLK